MSEGRARPRFTRFSLLKRIRKKFLAIDAEFDAIDTVHGVGYRWRP